ncbi:MAG: hypothetical protein DBX59_04790 [Bacillota bacterium]|nr:MAG: hypothetical protein DBX59_04790 [Bacillota bacterium]
MVIEHNVKKTDTVLAETGKTDFIAVLPDCPDEYEQFAASELCWIFSLAVGVKPEVVSEKDLTAKTRRIFLGKTEALKKLGEKPTFEEFSYDGYKIRTEGEDVYIYGLQRGTYFGVYEFCKIHFGYRYYAKTEIKIDKADKYYFHSISVFEKPDIDARSLGFWSTYKLEVTGNFEHACRMKLGRNLHTDWILSAHTYFQILPKEKYFAEHPDWYSPAGNNLCLTNEEMTAAFIESLKKIISETKGNYLMMGQEDNFEFCDCPRCRAKIAETGSPSAVMMRFSNKVAREIKAWLKETDPDRPLTLVTFAYNATNKPPVKTDENGKYVPACDGVVVEDNLAVMIVPFSCVYSKAYNDKKYNPAVADTFEGWSAVTKNMHVWTYCCNFDNYMINFNNWSMMKKNYSILRDYGVSFIFDQGSHNSPTPCFEELRQFLQAGFMWNLEQDEEQLTDEFFDEYYKDIAPHMKNYWQMFRVRWDFIESEYGEGARTGAGDSSCWNLAQFWPKEFLSCCMNVLNEARAKLELLRVKEWDKYLLLRPRLLKDSLSVRFILLNVYGNDYGSELSRMVQKFKDDCKACGILVFNEGDFMGVC